MDLEIVTGLCGNSKVKFPWQILRILNSFAPLGNITFTLHKNITTCWLSKVGIHRTYLLSTYSVPDAFQILFFLKKKQTHYNRHYDCPLCSRGNWSPERVSDLSKTTQDNMSGFETKLAQLRGNKFSKSHSVFLLEKHHGSLDTGYMWSRLPMNAEIPSGTCQRFRWSRWIRQTGLWARCLYSWIFVSKQLSF